MRLATEGGYPPFSDTRADGKLEGLDVDIGNALCVELQLRCSWVKVEWEAMIPALIAHKFDAIVASMSITEERKARVDFTDKYYASPLALVARKGSRLEPDVQVGPGGELVSFTIAFVDVDGDPLDEPETFGLVRLDGADAVLLHRVLEPPEDEPLEVGERVEVVVRPDDERTGSIWDIEGFRVVAD